MHQNAEIVRRGYQAFNAAEMTTLAEIIAENASWHVPGRSIIAGDHKGRDAIFAFFGRLGQDTGGTFKSKLLHLLADDDRRVVSFHQSTAERGGKRLDVGSCILFELENGRVVDAREHIYDLYANDAFWS